MSDAHTESPEAPLAKLFNILLNIGVPAVLLIMLGWTGIKFVGGMGDTEEEREAASQEMQAAAAAKAAASAPATGGAPAPDPAGVAVAGDAGASAISPEVMALGKSTYATCAACHGADGQGLQAGAQKMAPSLTGSEILMGDPEASILVILKGIQKEGMDYLGIMAALGAGLNDEQVAAVITYTRNEFDNTGDPVTADQVAAARAKFAEVDAPAGIKRDEIFSVVESMK